MDKPDTEPGGAAPDPLEAAREGLIRAHEKVMEELEKIEDPEEAFHRSRPIADTLGHLGEVLAAFRRVKVRALRDRDKLTLTALATKIGVAKSRAHFMVTGPQSEQAQQQQEGEAP